MIKVEAIIFDMDGVLMDTERISFESYQKVFKEYKYELDKKVFLKFIGRNFDGINAILKEEYGKDFPVDIVHEKKSKLALETINKDGVIIKPGVYELLEYLNNENYKIAVATSTRKERAFQLLEKAKIKDKVDYIICGDEVESSKPNPEIFLKAAKGLQINPENCIVIEDSDSGIKAAHAANMIAIHVPDMKFLDDDVKELAFKICENLFDVRDYLQTI